MAMRGIVSLQDPTPTRRKVSGVLRGLAAQDAKCHVILIIGMATHWYAGSACNNGIFMATFASLVR